MPFNSDEYSVAHPALSPDGKILYFASDMPGTLGQTDIFKVDINKGCTKDFIWIEELIDIVQNTSISSRSGKQE